jgi:Stress responsive A/B Barrel Domain
MIRHTVAFRLKHPKGSQEEQQFIDEAMILTSISTVKNFERLKQVSLKNNFSHGFSMEFDDQAAYETYNNHPTHVAYVRDQWIPNVADFMEIDYVSV